MTFLQLIRHGSDLIGLIGPAEQAAEKVRFAHEMPEEHTSAANAGLILLALCRG